MVWIDFFQIKINYEIMFEKQHKLPISFPAVFANLVFIRCGKQKLGIFHAVDVQRDDEACW